MHDPKALSGRRLAAPRALLLDFGGVIVETTAVPGWQALLAAEVAERLAGLPTAPTLAEIARDIGFGARADSRWKDAMSRPFTHDPGSVRRGRRARNKLQTRRHGATEITFQKCVCFPPSAPSVC